jgi:hypothetical protein
MKPLVHHPGSHESDSEADVAASCFGRHTIVRLQKLAMNSQKPPSFLKALGGAAHKHLAQQVIIMIIHHRISKTILAAFLILKLQPL